MMYGVGAALTAATVLLIASLNPAGERTLETKPGEQERVRLSDGSSILLNTTTKLHVRFTAKERDLILDGGQAFFEVAKNKTRPFRVFAGENEVRAIGTAFEVRRLGAMVQVTLEEGRVAIYRGGRPIGSPASASPTRSSSTETAFEPLEEVRPGDQIDLASGRPAELRHIDLRRTQAWRYGRMILDDAPLGAAVADLNRYGGVQIILMDPKLADIRVSGVFHTGRPDDFVEAVTAALPVQVEHRDGATIALRAR